MRQQIITIPLLNVLVQWIKDRLNEKSNTNHTHGSVTTTQDGFMTSADKTKLNGIASNATNTTVVNSLTSTSTTSALSANQGRLLNSSISGKADNNHTHNEATQTEGGFLSRIDKTKLDGIAANANKTTIVDTLTSTSTTSALSANQGRALDINKLGYGGGALSGSLVAHPSGNSRQVRNITIGTAAPTSTVNHLEGDIWLVVP